MIFPSIMSLSAQVKGVQLYMTCVPHGNKQAGFLEFSPTAEVPSLISRFVVERGSETDLVHIRSCYKNKYLCRTTTSGNYIVASGSNPVEDKKAVNCTLFKVKDLGSQVVTFTHVQSGYEVTSFPDNTLPQNLIIGTKALRFTVVTYNVLAKLPKRVIFKGNNGKYLRCRRQGPPPIISPSGFPVRTFGEHEYNEFTSKDGSDRSAHYEITHCNGTIRVKSVDFGKFWRRNRTYDSSSIWSDSDDTTVNNLDTLFKVENFGNNVIALRNIGNNKVCKPLGDEFLQNLLLKAVETYTLSETYLQVEEPVKFRIIDAQYKFDDARITSQSLKYSSFVEAINTSKDRDSELSDSYTYQKKRTTNWNSTTTITKNVNAEVNFKLPKFIDGKLQLSGERVEKNDLEKGSVDSNEAKAEYKIRVPPMTKAILKRFVMEVSYDIPFSCIQTDVYTTGEKVNFVVDAGVCQGFEAYGIHYIPDFIPL